MDYLYIGLNFVGSRAEKSATDLGGAVTGITDQGGLVCDDEGGAHIWAEVDVS